MSDLRDLPLEASIVGRALHRPPDLGDMLDTISDREFADSRHALVWLAIENLHEAGASWDLGDVLRECQPDGPPSLDGSGLVVTAHELMELRSAAVAGWQRSAARLIDLRARRQLRGLAIRLEADAADERLDTGDVLERYAAELGQVEASPEALPACLLDSVDLAYEESEVVPWVVPGLMRRRHRAIIVGFEGHGKTTLLSQVAWCASQGIHPFRRTRCEPVRVLHVDLENSRDRMTAGYRPIADQCRSASSSWEKGRMYTLHREDGMDLRGRRDRGQLDRVMAWHRPDLLVLGPLRKTYRRRNEPEESAALEVQAVFDDLRTRHDCALLLEHHAPHAAGGQKRDPRPFGSSTWLGWSEFGLGMEPERDDAGEEVQGLYHLSRWRNDRVKADWPLMISRGKTWPWDATYGAPEEDV